MTIEWSNGGPRGALPRSSDLPVPETVGEPSGQRAARGRFAPANGAALGAGWKHLLRESLGRDLQGEAGELARAASRLYSALLRELAHDNATTRSLTAMRARDTILAARYSRRATELGLDTPGGLEALRMALALGARVERLAITTLDLGVRYAKGARSRTILATPPWLEPAGGDDEPESTVNDTQLRTGQDGRGHR